MTNVQFVVPGPESKTDPIHHIAIQAAALILRDWLKESEPEPEEAKAMAAAIIAGLMGRSPPPH